MSQNIIEYPSLGTPPAGSIRFNTDSAKMEIYNGEQWWEIDATSPDLQTGATRGVILGGYNSPGNGSDKIGHINISSTGNEVNNGGNLLAARYGLGAVSDRTRGVAFGGRNDPSPAASVNVIQFVTIASNNDAIDFGDLLAGQGHEQVTGCSNRTRGIIGGGYQNPQSPATKNIISFITIQSLGDAQDFGDLSQARGALTAASAPTRGLFIGGRTGPGNDDKVTTIDFVTTSTQGNAADFGDQTVATSHLAGCSNAIRAISALGFQGSGYTGRVNSIDFITMATLGNATDFGDATRSNSSMMACSSSTRGVIVGGAQASSPYGVNTMDYVEIMTTGNALDFGDLTTTQAEAIAALSNGHGGLG